MARLQPWYPLISFSDCMHAAAEPRFVWLFKDGSCAVRSVAMLGLCFFLREQLCKLGGAAGLAYIQLRGTHDPPLQPYTHRLSGFLFSLLTEGIPVHVRLCS